MAEKFSETSRIPCYFTDANYRLRPVSFMDMCQDIAGHAAIELDFGDDVLMRECNAAWVLVRMHVSFLESPQRWQDVKLETWHRGLQSIFFVRDYSLKDMQGRPLVNATSSWVVIDVDERRVLRSDKVRAIPKEAQCDEAAIGLLAEKIVLPQGAEPVYVLSHRVSYGDVDYNHHANNAKYVAWAMDAVPEEMAYSKPLKELSINFNREIRPGETVDLYRSYIDGTFIIEGKVGADTSFIISLTF